MALFNYIHIINIIRAQILEAYLTYMLSNLKIFP